MDMGTLGALIRDWRTEYRVQQGDLAVRAGIPQAALSDIERGKIELGVATHRPTHERALAITRALDLPESVIADATDEATAGVDAQLAAAWAISARPMDDLAQLVPMLALNDQRTLVRLARVMAAGRLVDRG